MNSEDREEIRKIIEDELRNATGKKGLVVQRVGVPLGSEELRGLAAPVAGDQCCNGCD